MFDPAPTAFIFDMDGTILDNMKFHTRAWLQVLDELGQPRWEPDAWERRTSGVPNRTILHELLGLDLDDAGIARWVERKESLYREFAAGAVQEIPGCTAYIRGLRASGGKVALATGAGRTNIDFNLRALNMLHDFDAVVGADDVKRGKPEPDIFLAAAARLGAAPENCVVFEDAPMGLEAARRAGMRAVCVTSMMTESDARAWPNVVGAVRDFQGMGKKVESQSQSSTQRSADTTLTLYSDSLLSASTSPPADPRGASAPRQDASAGGS